MSFRCFTNPIVLTENDHSKCNTISAMNEQKEDLTDAKKIVKELTEKFERLRKRTDEKKFTGSNWKNFPDPFTKMFNGMPNQQFQQPQQQQQQQQQGGNNGFLFGGPDLNTIARAKQQAFSSSGNSQLMSMFNGCNSGGNEPQTPCNMSPCGMMGPNTTMFNLMPLTTPQKQGHANNQQQQQQGNYNGMSFNSNLNSIPVPDHPSSAFPSFDCIMNQTQNSQTNNTFGGPAAFGGMPNLMNLNNQPGNQMNQGSNWNQMPCNNGFFPGPCGSNNGQMQNQQHGHQNGENGMIQMRTLF